MLDRSVLGIFARRADRGRPPAAAAPVLPNPPRAEPAAEDAQEELLWLALQHRLAMRDGTICRSGGRRLADEIIVERLLRRA